MTSPRYCKLRKIILLLQDFDLLNFFYYFKSVSYVIPDQFFRILLLNKLLEDGNTLFKKEKLKEASHRYQYALRRMPSLTNMSRNKSTFETLTVHLLLNLSRCKRKSGHITEAVEMANKVLRIHPDRCVYIESNGHNRIIMI